MHLQDSNVRCAIIDMEFKAKCKAYILEMSALFERETKKARMVALEMYSNHQRPHYR